MQRTEFIERVQGASMAEIGTVYDDHLAALEKLKAEGQETSRINNHNVEVLVKEIAALREKLAAAEKEKRCELYLRTNKGHLNTILILNKEIIDLREKLAGIRLSLGDDYGDDPSTVIIALKEKLRLSELRGDSLDRLISESTEREVKGE